MVYRIRCVRGGSFTDSVRINYVGIADSGAAFLLQKLKHLFFKKMQFVVFISEKSNR